MTKKIVAACFVLFCLFAGSCTDEQVKNAIGDKTLPTSTGDIDEIVLLMPDNLWQGSAGDTLRHFLLQDFELLPQSEPMFDIRPLGTMKQFTNMLQRSAVVVFMADMSNTGNDITMAVQEQLQQFKAAGKDAPPFFARRDVWATPQRVIYFYASSANELTTKIAANNKGLIQQLYEIGNLKAYNNAYAAKPNDGIANMLAKDYGVELKVPNNFEEAQKKTDFAWFRADNEATEEVLNLMLYTKPYSGGKSPGLTLSTAIALRNEMSKNITSQIQGSYQVADTTLGFVTRMVKMPSGNEALEVRGLWRMHKDFMGGPFLLYLIDDAAQQRLIVTDGFVFAPKIDKRRLMRKLEMVLRSTRPVSR
ncbi:DUF4837 domain-containing protein [Sphingobacteriales bacterium UPWRP_1]|nr:hypothetical protein BVG80_07765 [Sphingobacteriales bacterium TSM_CSM]PSJ73695.1 DUF4837 domain-containing protein [Sphingobacteriales bacterium UPWRP_1]